MSEDGTACRIDRLAGTCTLEFAAYAGPAAAVTAAWPSAPGAVRYDAQRRPQLLHFAPGRWLAPDPDAEIRALLADAALAEAGVVLDVTGKWDALRISGAGASRLLACAIAVEPVLEARDCAAVTLFDCPAILTRAADGFALWVQSSYATDFAASAERFRTALDSPP
jgi:heterotetrameric sarcosine oxidase gamma subunit